MLTYDCCNDIETGIQDTSKLEISIWNFFSSVKDERRLIQFRAIISILILLNINTFMHIHVVNNVFIPMGKYQTYSSFHKFSNWFGVKRNADQIVKMIKFCLIWQETEFNSSLSKFQITKNSKFQIIQISFAKKFQ